MARRKRKRKRKFAGNGIGPHQEVSPLARGTSTPSRDGFKAKADRRAKQHGWRHLDE